MGMRTRRKLRKSVNAMRVLLLEIKNCNVETVLIKFVV